MNRLLRKIVKEFVVAAKEAPRMYFEPFVLIYNWIVGSNRVPGPVMKRNQSR